MPESRATRHTLIRRACDPADQAAWIEFDRIYRRFISFVLGKLGVETDDIDDLTQQILLTLTRDLPGYDKERARFRTWLSAVIRHAALAHLRRQRVARGRLSELIPNAPDSSEPEIDRRIESEWATYLASMAMERVREKFEGSAMEVFELSLDGLSTQEISARTGLATASVFTLRKRVKKRLYLEIRSLIAELEP
jgi:RNA polymerase sigma-70 factor (ECF subfamily)